MQKVNEWINKHQHEFNKTLEKRNQIKINWEQEHKIINNLREEINNKYKKTNLREEINNKHKKISYSIE